MPTDDLATPSARLRRLAYLLSEERFEEKEELALDPAAEERWDQQDFDETMRIMEGLGSGGDRALLPSVGDHLRQCLVNRNAYGRDIFGEVLASLAGVAALPELLQAAAHDLGDDQDSFSSTIAGVLERDPAGSRPCVLTLLSSPDPALRRTGAWALDYVVQPADLDILRTLAGDDAPSVRAAAAAGLGQLAGRNSAAWSTLEAMLADADPQARLSALTAFMYVGSAEVIPAVTRLADDPVSQVREEAAHVLRRLSRDGEAAEHGDQRLR